MAKESGLGAEIQVDNHGGTPVDISDDVTDFTFSTPYGVQDVTGVDELAHERLLLLADASASFKGVFNLSTSHPVFSVMGNVRTVNIAPTDTSGGAPYLAMEMLLTSYELARAAAGELTFTVPAVLANGAVPSWTNS